MAATVLVLAACSTARPDDIVSAADAPTTDGETRDETATGTSQFEARCATVGVDAYTAEPLPEPALPDPRATRDSLISVTTDSPEVNGDVSGVDQLLANPGEDGVSLTEAIMVTNNVPGEYTIRFARDLRGAVIDLEGSRFGEELPLLAGGGVFIDGDIDGSGRPDIAIQGSQSAIGMVIASSGNRVHALELRNFRVAVGLFPDAPGQSYSDNVISNSVFTDVYQGVVLFSGDEAAAGGNRWTGIQVVGNDIQAEARGIFLGLHWNASNVVEDLVIANNAITIAEGSSGENGRGIELGAGYWAGSTDNRIAHAFITGNTIGGSAGNAIAVVVGAVGASRNVIEDVRIVGNRASGTWVDAFLLITGDVATDWHDATFSPVGYPEENVLKHVAIDGNEIVGQTAFGINIAGGMGGARFNEIQDVRVQGNQIRTVVPAIAWDVGGIRVGAHEAGDISSRGTASNAVTGVVITHNSISMGGNPTPSREITHGAIYVGGGRAGVDGRVTDVEITANDIDFGQPGIAIVGGFSEPQDASVATGNVVSKIAVGCNHIAPATSLLSPSVATGAKGVSLIGGAGTATLNVVSEVQIADNVVNGRPDDVSSVPNETCRECYGAVGSRNQVAFRVSTSLPED